MFEHHFGPGPHDFGGFGGGGPAPLWLSALLTGVTLLWWIGVPLLLIWAGSRLLGQRQTVPQPLAQPVELTAREMLRQRYVLGEIDATTFERMLERVMFSEAQEKMGQRLYPRDAIGRVRIWEPADGDTNSVNAPGPRDIPPPAPAGSSEIV